MLLAIVQALFVGFVPGYLAYRLPVCRRALRASLHADERVFWSVILSLAWSLSIALALAAVGRYHLDTLVLINAVGSAAMLLAARRRLSYTGTARPASWSALLPLVLIVTTVWLYRPASEFIVGGRDPGAYMNEGIQIAQRGAFVVVDPVVAAVRPEARDLFFPFYGTSDYYSLRFMGFFVKRIETGTVVGQFPHLFPISIAIGYGLNGLSGARDTVVWWTALGFAAFYLLGARTFGRAPAFAACLLLMLNVVFVWFGRFPNAEVVQLTLMSAAILATTRATLEQRDGFGGMAAWLLVLLLFLRIDAIIGIVAVLGAVLLARSQGHRIGRAFWSMLIVGVVLWWPYLTGPLAGYAQMPRLFTGRLPIVPMITGASLVAACLWAIRANSRAARFIRRSAPWVMALSLVGLGLYAFFMRTAGPGLAPHDADSLRTFAWYVGPQVLALLAIALLTVGRQLFWRDPAFFLVASAYGLFFFYKIRIVPEHFWLTRRFVPIILPATLLLVCALAAWLARRVAWRVKPTAARAAAIVAVAVIALPIGALFAQQSRPVLRHVEYAGMIPKLERLAGRFTRDDLIIAESRNASDVHVLALPLAYIYDRQVLVLASPAPDKRLMEAFIRDARTRYREIYFLGGGGTDLLTKRIGVRPLDGDRFQVAEYEASAVTYPTHIRAKEFDYGVYRFVDAHDLASLAAFAIGDDDDLQVLRFHAKERDPGSGHTYRWTRATSYISLLNVQPTSRSLVLTMANGNRPATAGIARVSVSIGGRLLGDVEVDGARREYAFDIPQDLAAFAAASEDPTRVTLTSSTWIPKSVIGGTDDRDLGVMLWRVEVR